VRVRRARTRATALVLAAALAVLAGCGREEDGLRRESVAEILVTPTGQVGELLTQGLALPVGRFGFVLADRDRSILVSVPPELARSLRRGERVEILAGLGRLTDSEAIEVANAFQRDSDLRSDYRRLAAAAAPSDVGAPYLRLEAFVDRGRGSRAA